MYYKAIITYQSKSFNKIYKNTPKKYKKADKKAFTISLITHSKQERRKAQHLKAKNGKSITLLPFLLFCLVSNGIKARALCAERQLFPLYRSNRLWR
jgi:hypothetical protein